MDLRASRFKRVGSPKVIRCSRPEGLDWPPWWPTPWPASISTWDSTT